MELLTKETLGGVDLFQYCLQYMEKCRNLSKGRPYGKNWRMFALGERRFTEFQIATSKNPTTWNGFVLTHYNHEMMVVLRDGCWFSGGIGSRTDQDKMREYLRIVGVESQQFDFRWFVWPKQLRKGEQSEIKVESWVGVSGRSKKFPQMATNLNDIHLFVGTTERYWYTKEVPLHLGMIQNRKNRILPKRLPDLHILYVLESATTT
jgi:hypothetical protein